jgi:hypothetical protein
MKKFIIAISALFIFGAGCKSDSDYLDIKPTQVLSTELAFSDPAQVLSILADLYNRQYDYPRLTEWVTLGDFNEAFYSQNDQYNNYHGNSTWDFRGYRGPDFESRPAYFWTPWDYKYIRELNLFMERCAAGTALDEPTKALYIAEARFLRASYYFTLTQYYGGVPLILSSLEFNGSDVTALQFPRKKESEMYDFVIKEAEELKVLLPANANTKARATKGAALAMESRAALYAGSIAKYGATTPSVSLSGGEVGIPTGAANAYYTTALKAAEELITGGAGAYSLYKKQPANLSENFAAIFYDKTQNNEVIWVDDYALKFKRHGFTQVNQPRFGAEEEEGGRINPSLNLVQSFEKLDNTFEPLATNDINGNFIYYTNQQDIFAGRDARLGGTVIIPGSSFKSRPVDIWAGVQLADGTVISGSERGAQKVLPGKTVTEQVVGFDGPISGIEHSAQTGFYIRKYQDPAIGSGQRGVGSAVWRVRYRFAEVLLNAAEAAFELGQNALAANYMNEVRSRAGLTVPLTAGDITFDRIVHERRVEFAFEGEYFFDLKRFRIAHKIFDGVALSKADLLSNLSKATKRSTQPYGLLPYKFYAPGSPNNGKWIFKVDLSNKVTASDNWQLGNYYSQIEADILTKNPKLVKQPNQ